MRWWLWQCGFAEHGGKGTEFGDSVGGIGGAAWRLWMGFRGIDGG